jgi:hypothetical protein
LRKSGACRVPRVVGGAVGPGFRVDVFHRPVAVESSVEMDMARNPQCEAGEVMVVVVDVGVSP